MRIASLTIQSFQCFGPEPTVIELDKTTSFIGANGAGKTAALAALCRLFSTNMALRRLRPTDFHVPGGEKLDSQDERNLLIEARIEFPELDARTETAAAVPPSFHAMVVSEPGGPPFCRARLEGKWTKTLVESGDVEEKLYWITSPEPEPGEGHRVGLKPHERARIQVHYVPATRNTAQQLANVSGTLLHRLLGAVIWDPTLRNKVQSATDELSNLFRNVPAVNLINEANKENWNELYTEDVYSTPALSFASSDLDCILKNVAILFGPTHDNTEHDCDRLSEGQQSLFYFAFINTLFSIGQDVYAATCAREQGQTTPGAISEHISCDRLNPPPLTLFAVEEPENHLSPHYLGRLMNQLKQISHNDCAQVVVTSHSAAIVSRVDPKNIRHFRMDHRTCEARVRAITLPQDAPEAAKYVNEAVRAFPELYFARVVVLCEGDSEQVILPRFASVSGSELDLAFVSVVPLGGRHVNHLWRLLTDLGIPYVTLLDLDRERKNGGWATLKYVLQELLAFYPVPVDRSDLLGAVEDDNACVLSDDELGKMHTWDATDAENLDRWCKSLEKYGVFFSQPLDLDLMMLRSFPKAYQATATPGGGPVGLEDGSPTEERITQAAAAIFGESGGSGSSYRQEERELFPWYTHLFLGKGKPATHTVAWLEIPSGDRKKLMPKPIGRLLRRVSQLLKKTPEQ